jgi:hypothetical protein
MNTNSPLQYLISPLRTAKEMPASVRVLPAALLVLGAGMLLAVGMALSIATLSFACPMLLMSVLLR